MMKAALACLAVACAALTFGLAHVERLRSLNEQHLYQLQQRIEAVEQQLKPPPTVTCYRWGPHEQYRDVPCDLILPEHPKK